MPVVQRVPRNLEEPARIFGLTPIELAACALLYAGTSSLLRGLPFSSLISLGIGTGFAFIQWTLNRVKPPMHGLFWILAALRPPIVPVMTDGKDET